MTKPITTIQDIRTSYIEFFENKGHLHVESAGLLPAQDPSLLFTTAGMVPFKDYFAGTQKPPRPRLVSVQKCFRTTDLEEVGKTLRHLSFFEMLGNFSFGDYFKKEAIEFAWEYSTQYLPFLPEQIWITIFRNDDEAYELWHRHIGIPRERIVRLDEADNFWGPAGNTGACGPCSELYIDRGEGYSFDPDNAKPGGEGDRFMEYWNLVFNQFNKNSDGKFEPLQKTGIDTGAGLERLATLIQGVDSVYDTNELKNLRDEVARIYNVRYQGEQQTPIRVLTDHARALTFALADGIFPSNESRGYVLRRMLRRGLLFGRKLGQKEAQLYKLVKTVNLIYGDFYNNLLPAQELSEKYIRAEEERFLQTLDAGSQKLEEILEVASTREKKTIQGQEAFLLYDTFGFPLEMTVEMAEQKSIQVDVASFHEKMEEQRERGRKAWKGSANEMPQLQSSNAKINSTRFLGYQTLKANAVLLAIAHGEQKTDSLQENDIAKDETFFLIFNQTPFYAESGGQVGDSGFLFSDTAKLEIIDTQKNGSQFVHLARHLEGTLQTGKTYALQVDETRRKKITANHSATHLLNAALRHRLGEHVKQSGSLVNENYLRFDFTHPSAMLDTEIRQVETEVNQAIDSAYKVDTKEMEKSSAEKLGAVMAFGEKYGQQVRVVNMGTWESPASLEFCGGTHVTATSDIGFFLIQKEGSPGAGNRRLEALTGAIARQALQQLGKELKDKFLQVQKQMQQMSKAFKEQNQKAWENILSIYKNIFIDYSAPAKATGALALSHQWNGLRNLKKELLAIETALRKQQKKKKQKASTQVDTVLIEKLLQNTSVKRSRQNNEKFFYVNHQLQGYSLVALKTLADALREKNSKLILLLASVEEKETDEKKQDMSNAENTKEKKWNIVLASSAAVCEALSLDCNRLLKEALAKSALIGGGGGKKELAQAGGLFSEQALLSECLDMLDKAFDTLF